MSITLIDCDRLLALPQRSTATQRRTMTCAQPTELVVVKTLGIIRPSQPSTNTGAVKTGTDGHSTVPSGPWLIVTAGGVVSRTLMTCITSDALRHASLIV